MEKKLKKQRNRLYLRIILILVSVWLIVSAAYCAIRLYNATDDVQSRELGTLSYAKMEIAGSKHASFSIISLAMNNITNGYINQVTDENFDSQLIVTDRKNKKTFVNTAGKLPVQFSFKLTNESSISDLGFLDYQGVLDSISGSQYREIKKYLTTERSDGKRYELVCTKFALKNVEFKPIEVVIALTDGNDDSWFVNDEIIKEYTLRYDGMDEIIFECSEMRRNVIPKSFIIDGICSKDFISSLSKQEQNLSLGQFFSTPFDYIFYATDFISSGDTPYFLQYAKQIRLLDLCGADLLAGSGIIFAFFLIIAVILCLMIWRTVRVQIIQEQKRSDLTNALAHDIKTPLFVISGYAYSLQENIDESERESYIQKIIDRADDINSLVQKMLNLSKLDSYAMTLNKTEFSLPELLREAVDSLPKLKNGKKITLKTEGDGEITADRELIKTAVQNLIENAVKYSLPESEIIITQSGKTLSISNECEPLNKSELKQIWQPYYRADKTRRKNGNGLGLSIVKSIFDLHKIRCETKMKDTRLTFEVRFS